MALGPLQGREPARAVAKGPTLKWGSGGMAGGTAAAALRLPLVPGVNGTATSKWRVDQEDMDEDEAEGEGAGTRPRPPPPPPTWH